jgi:hypothetical protein
MAAETFDDGLRGYYFAFAVIGWFFSPWVFMAATAGVVFILYRHEFTSEVPGVLMRQREPTSDVSRQTDAAELPLRLGREEVAIAGPHVAGRRGA